ncbi:rho guanine nucleotide exchange factor 12 [Nematolebias whitei]|uniref:rho guanine nucleotide exchange factor 12 n=1 Tax=Nematolebias whitei TaxID=451745 RepID=UPI0018985FC2|nr:rho guanine nucleotide exchange factor 12 [Nematolebias whitei]
MKEKYNRNPSPKLLKDIQEATKHIPQLQGQLFKATGTTQEAVSGGDEDNGSIIETDCALAPKGDNSTDLSWSSTPVSHTLGPVSPDSHCPKDSSCASPKSTPRNSFNSCHSPEAEDGTDLDPLSPITVTSRPPYRFGVQIIGAEDDCFDSDQEQTNGQCNSFNSIDQLKCRPAHLAAFLHHVISQFDPAPVLCYLYADFYKQTNPKETRRVFLDFHTIFMDRAANLKVPVPESVSSDLNRRRTDLIPEEINRQYVQTLQDSLFPDILKNLEDFRQKRSMGLTVAEVELNRLDQERVRDRVTLERECSYAENIISKIDDILVTTQPTEEEKCTTIQYVIYTYMKHLGVRVKEPRNLEPKRVRISFLPKMKKSIKSEKEGDEKVEKKPRFTFRAPQRWPSRNDGIKGPDNRTRPQRQVSQPILVTNEQMEGVLRGSQSSEGPELTHSMSVNTSSPNSITNNSDTSQDADIGGTPTSGPSKLTDGIQSDPLGGLSCPASHLEFFSLDHLQEDDRESDRAPEGTPKAIRRLEGLGAVDVQSEDDQGTDSEHDPPNWQQLVGREVLAGLRPHEIKRQEVINELFYTERAHVRMLKVLDHVFYQKLSKDAILPPADIKNIFTNLEEVLQLHVSLLEQMTAVRKRNGSSVIDQIGDDLLSWFSGGEEKIKQAVGTFCSNQPFALEIIKTKQKKDSRFTSFIQEAESNRLCRRLQLKDIIPVEMLRLTKYPLLLDNIVKYTDNSEEKVKVKQAADCCRRILSHVNQALKESEDKQKLEDYQRRLDLSSLKQTDNPMILELKNLDLTKKTLIHEGPLSWKVNKDKTIELYTLLLEDILVLLQKQDERLILKCHSTNLAGTADTKHIYSPIIKQSTVLVRSVATDNKSFFVISMSENGPQIYELMAPTVSDKKTWQSLISQRADTMKTKPHSVIPLPQPDGERDGVEIISAGASRLSRDADRTSTGSAQFTDKESNSSPRSALQSSPIGSNPFEEEKKDEEEEEGFVDPELPYQVAEVDREGDLFDAFPSRAEEALKTLAALKQVLVTQLMSQEAAEQTKRSTGARLLRTTSLRTPTDSRAMVMVHNSSEKSSSKTQDLAQDLGSGDTGFFDSPEDYGCLVLEGYGGPGESSTDDDIMASTNGKQLSTSQVCAADSGINLRFSSTSQVGSLSSFSRQVLSHLRNLQTNLNCLKEVEAKYNNLIRQRPERSITDMDENKDKR